MWELDYEESWALKNWCFWTVVLEKTLESPLDCKEIQPFHPKGNQSWIFLGRTDVEAETPMRRTDSFEKTLIWERLKAGGEGDDRGWDDWMASPTRWTWVWVSSKSWWWTGRPGVLQPMGSQRVRNEWATELNGIELVCVCVSWTSILCTIIMLVRDPHPRMVVGSISEKWNSNLILDVGITSRFVAQIPTQCQTLVNYQSVYKLVVC